jgi:nucleotide-binding universal stress UspA family protein
MKILVATDGSKNALHAVKYAATLAAKTGVSTLTLVSVHDDAGLRHAKSLVGKEAVADYLREQSEKDLKAARKLLDSEGVKFDMIIRSGHVAKEIVSVASKGKFDLIVMGSKGRSALTDLVLGSVAQRVLSMSTQPVLLVK